MFCLNYHFTCFYPELFSVLIYVYLTRKNKCFVVFAFLPVVGLVIISPQLNVVAFLQGFEWNKYNQTHYDIDNPPPKIVQGYKFNVSHVSMVT